MSKISESVLARIKKGEVKVKPKWRFVLLHVLLWVLVGLAVLVGSMFTAFVLRDVYYTEWGLVPRLGRGFLRGYLPLLPYLWLILLAAITGFSMWLFSKTPKGYKFKHWMILGGVVVLSLIIGFCLFVSRAADRVDDLMQSSLPPYQQLQNWRERVWMSPEEGVLSGKIRKIKSDSLWIIDDLTGKRWNLQVEQYEFLPRVGLPIIAVGMRVGDMDFVAESVHLHCRGDLVCHEVMRMGR